MEYMNLDEAIVNRRSIRIYSDELVNDEIIREIIQAGTWAPSACNIQGWKFIVINEPKQIEALIKRGTAAFMKNVKQAILVVYENTTDNLEYKDHIQSASAAIQNMILKAHSIGVGTCWINNLPQKSVMRKIFKIPKSYDPIALISLGNITKNPNLRERKYILDDLISYNYFNFEKINQKSATKLFVKRIARKIYFKLPFKKLLIKFAGKFEKKFNN